mmetsp:Transcript_9017/g.13336  ORF Transcript_9017/g.13336 Transcript_9017/m.13336 type:complete len:173 (+) Transcript_9017:288-806(+)|eukprot:CAMPEP_0196806140 /NCGR_PEP_ID=MMETSP1362-20130617/6005_1 /TAXON_ID=163516 /ORGANISM="Leptocylindrus danicus, Strain CCMP1856" /LENGTH=172 /DNA_ID=CAMNT_0042179465 /DNA_START=261 /DNA_END=779 /DNA_ORIENTATION=+
MGILKIATQEESVQRRGVNGTTISGSGTEKKTEHVGFKMLFIKEFLPAIGDNPCVRNGPPIGLDWKTVRDDEIVLPIEDYEKSRAPRRSGSNLVLPRKVREKILMDQGYARSDFAKAVRSVLKAKKQRVQTINNLNMAEYEEKFEAVIKFLVCKTCNKKGAMAFCDNVCHLV